MTGVGWLIADMVDEADGPDDEGGTGCPLAVDTPDIASAFEDDQSPRAAFLFLFALFQPPNSPVGGCCGSLFGC
jgi:hypothetical protein